ncbi:MAG: haloalkane dehalogenase 2 [Leptospiraceae bacterium]|nr:MAG: haloalkane dehalogenase 2 [Leptospiraceae bacterium]
MKRPFDIDPDLYPFQDNWIEIDNIMIHYVDEGPKDSEHILICFHGNPTWSLLYSEIIKKLKDSIRIIAPDYPGFGMSSKPKYPDYTYIPEAHSRIMEIFLNRLGIFENQFSIFIQDWGGPIGLSAIRNYIKNLKHIFLGNTWAWKFKEGTKMYESAKSFSEKMGGDTILEQIKQKNSFLMISLPLLLRGIKKRNPEKREALKKAYLAPFNTEESRIPTWVFPRSIIRSSDLLEEIEKKVLPLIQNIPSTIFWGEKDMVFPPIVREEWEKILNHYRRVDFPDASHFFQEEEPEQIAIEIKKDLKIL